MLGMLGMWGHPFARKVTYSSGQGVLIFHSETNFSSHLKPPLPPLDLGSTSTSLEKAAEAYIS